jgi:hypothetical protein
VFNIYGSTIEKEFDPIFADIEFECDLKAQTGRFRVPGVMEMSLEPIRNPVTGKPHRARIDLSHGFEYSLAEMGSATFKTTGPIAMTFEDCYAQFAHIHLNNHGVVKSAAA